MAPHTNRVVAIDSAPEAIDIARQRVSPGKVSFLIGDAYDLPTDQTSFNAAFAGFWFSHVPKQRQREFLGGLSAAVVPGATIILVDNRYVEGSNHRLLRKTLTATHFSCEGSKTALFTTYSRISPPRLSYVSSFKILAIAWSSPHWSTTGWPSTPPVGPNEAMNPRLPLAVASAVVDIYDYALQVDGHRKVRLVPNFVPAQSGARFSVARELYVSIRWHRPQSPSRGCHRADQE